MAQQSRPSFTQHVEFLNRMFKKAFKRGAFLPDGPETTHNIVVSFTAMFDLAQTIDQQNEAISRMQEMTKLKQQPAQQPQQPAAKPCAGCEEKKDGKEASKDGQ